MWQALNAPPAEGVKAAATSFLEIRTVDGKVALAGVVPDHSAKNRLLARARAVHGRSKVIDRIEVDGSAGEAPWVKTAASILASTRRTLGEAWIIVTEDAVTVKGSVPDEAARKKILSGVSSAAPALKVVDELVVAAPASAAAATARAMPAPKTAAPVASAAPAGRAGLLEAKLRSQTARFEFNSADVTPQEAPALDRIAGIIKDTPDIPVEVSGHTCSMGDSAYNLHLSKRRAENARRYLIDRGVRADRLTTVGYGEGRPVADNATREGRQKNRRTEFHVKKGE